MVDVNIKGFLYCIALDLQGMPDYHQGHIIHESSVAGYVGNRKYQE